MNVTRRQAISSLASGLMLPALGRSQTNRNAPDVVAGIPVNYDESKVGQYTLPDPLRLANGKTVKDKKTWFELRRPEIIRLYEENQFGKRPGPPSELRYEVFEKRSLAFDGAAVRRQVTIYFKPDKTGPKMDLLLYLPPAAKGRVPVLLTPSFTANSTASDDPGVKPGEIWNRENKKVPAPKSSNFGRLNVKGVVGQGIGLASVYYGDIEPDFQGGLPYGIRALYLKPGQTEPAPDEWGAIAAWTFGLSRAIDYLEKDESIDPRRIGLYGVSRLGKTVLWAGAQDTRVALVIASCSGEGGAALSRRNYGETVKHLTAPSRYPYQFCANYAKYGDHVDQLPVDGHMLISLIAPRPLLLQTGDTDYWSDPKGEFLAAVAAGPVYRVLGKEGLGTDQWPPAGQPILHPLGYYMHAGGHGTLPGDWDTFLKFMGTYL